MSGKKMILSAGAALAAGMLILFLALSPGGQQPDEAPNRELGEALNRELAAAPPGRGGITALTYDEENKRLLVAWTDGYFDLWDVAGGSRRTVNASLERQEDRSLGVEEIRFTPDKRRFFTSSPSAGIQLWDVKTGQVLHDLSESGPYHFQGPVTYAGTGDLYLLSGQSGMEFFDGRDLALSPAAPGFGGSRPVAAVDPLAGLAAIGATEAPFRPEAADRLRLYRLTAGQGPPKLSPVKEIEFKNQARGYLLAAAFAADGRSLYTVSTSGRVDQWSVPALENLKTRTLELTGVYDAEFWPAQGLLAVAGFTGLNRVDGDHLVKVLSLSSGQAVTAPVTGGQARIVFIPALDKVLAIHGRRASLIDPWLQSDGESREVRKNDAAPAGGRPEPPRAADPRNKYPGFVEKFAADHRALCRRQGSWASMTHSLAYDEKHQRLIVGRESGQIDIWDLNTSSKRATVPAKGQFRAGKLSFDADGRRFFGHLSSANQSVHMWDAATGQQLHTAPGYEGGVFYTGIKDLYLMHTLYDLYFFEPDLSRETLVSRTPARWAAAVAVDEKNAVAAVNMGGFLGLYRISGEGEWPALEKAGESVPFEWGGRDGIAFFDPEGKNLYVVLTRPGRLVQWSVPGLKKINSWPLGFEIVTQAKVSPDKKLLALTGLPDPRRADGGHVAALLKLGSGRGLAEPMNSNVVALEFVPDLNVLLAVHGCSVTAFELP